MSFDPTRSLTDQIRIVENALLVPRGRGRRIGISRPGGVFDASGAFVEPSVCCREPWRPTVFAPDAPPSEEELAGVETLAGDWLYGGVLYRHFGHFLLESTGRLWVPGKLDRKLTGEIFIPQDRAIEDGNAFIAPVRGMLGSFGARSYGSQARVAIRPLRVERLVVAPQGIGLGPMTAAAPEYRDWVRTGLATDIPAEGAEKVYVSRSRLKPVRGRYLGEPQLEALLEAEGYRIFHPQNHPLAEQIAQYKAATTLVAAEGSALHLAAFFLRAEGQVAIIARRPGSLIGDYLNQFRYFSGAEVKVIERLVGTYWHRGGAKRVQENEIYAEIDLAAIGRDLAELGLVRGGSAWAGLAPQALAEARQSLGAAMETELIRVEPTSRPDPRRSLD